MKVFRISRKKYIKDLTGTGAMQVGGRWNNRGSRLLYTSQSKSLAALEVLIHMDKDTIPDNLQILTLTIPDKEINELEDGFRKKMIKNAHPLSESKNYGTNWIKLNESLGLRVPTILIPGEWNIIINPDHKNFKKIEILEIEDFEFDERFFN